MNYPRTKDSWVVHGNKRTLEKEPAKVGSIEVGVDVKTCDECEYKKKAEKEKDNKTYKVRYHYCPL